MHGIDRLFQELKKVLKGDDVEAANAAKIGDVFKLSMELLNGVPFSCQPCDPNAPDPTAKAEDEGASSSANADGDQTPIAHPSASLIPRLVDGLKGTANLTFLQIRAEEIIQDWSAVGMPALLPQTTASLALLRAYDEVVAPARRNGTVMMSKVPELTPETVAKQAGMSDKVVKKHLSHPELPRPTALLRDATEKLQREEVITGAIADAAQRTLEAWLSNIGNGSIRSWCRATHPRALAACALHKAVAADGVIAGSFTTEQVAAALNSEDAPNDKLTAGTVEAAVKSMPSGA